MRPLGAGATASSGWWGLKQRERFIHSSSRDQRQADPPSHVSANNDGEETARACHR